MANPQHVYHMHKLSKTYPGGKQVLKDISLSFFPGAKIGVVGLNGAGKSTLLKIMAGQLEDFIGEAWAADGVRVGYLSQEPELDAVEGRARQRHGGGGGEEGAGRPLQRAGRQLFRRDGRGDGQAAGRDRGAGPVGPRHAGGAGAGRAALSAGRCRGRQALGRREAARGADQAAARQARHPAARRADQPSRRGVGRLARALSQGLRRLHHAGDARPLLPRQHHGVDAGARSRPGRALQGQLLELAGAEGQAPRGREGAGGGQAAHAQARAGMDQVVAQGAAGQIQGAHPGLRQARRGGRPRGDRQGADPDPAGAAARRHGGGGRGPVEGVRRQAADRQPLLQAAARRHRRRHRPQRRRQDHAVQDDHGGGEAGRRRHPARRQRQARLRRPEPRSSQRQEDRVGGGVGRARHHEARRQDGGELAAPMSAGSTSRGPTSRRRWGCCRAASGTACIWPRC